jgi:hypothetical protein
MERRKFTCTVATHGYSNIATLAHMKRLGCEPLFDSSSRKMAQSMLGESFLNCDCVI